MQQSFSVLEPITPLTVDGSIGARIRARRKALKLTQDQLGDLVGIPGDVVSKHERGELGVGAKRLLAYARALETTAEWLSGDAGEPQKPGPKPGQLRAVSGGVPRALVALLNDGRCNPVTEPEIDYLTRYLEEGRSQELIDLEIHLLAHRAEREQTDEAVMAFHAAIKRKRKEAKRRASEGVSAPAEATKPEMSR